MTHFLLLILLILGAVLHFMTPTERTRLFKAILPALQKVKEAVALDGLQCDSFFDALRARNRRVIAMPVLIVLSTIVFVRSPVLGLFISAVCLWQIGLILERIVGPLAFVTVYIASGVAAGIVTLSVSPSGMSAGPTASVIGMYGFLLVTSIWSTIQDSSLTIPFNITKRLAPVAAAFVLYKLATTGLWNGAEVAALACGLIGGIVVARDVIDRTPQVRRLATAMATVVMVATIYALMVVPQPVNQTVDVRPEIDRVMTVESRTAALYDKEVDRFRRGRTTAAALIDLIDKTIVPELHQVAGRLRALRNAPAEQKPLIASAETFLKLRDESWQLRAAALRKSDLPGLRRADSKDQASREAFQSLSNMVRAQNDAQERVNRSSL